MQRDALPRVSTPIQATHTARPAGLPPAAPPPARAPAPHTALPPAPAPVATARQKQKEPQRQASNRRQRAPRHATPAALRQEPRPARAQSPATAQRPPSAVIDKDGFILAERRKRRQRRNRNQRGAATTASTTLRAATPCTMIYLSRVHTSMTRDHILDYINKMCEGRVTPSRGFGVEITLLESSRPTNFRSFRLRVPAAYQGMFLSPDFWPKGIVFRRYREAVQKTKSLPSS